MSWTPSFKLYDEAGSGLIHTFEAVQFTNAPQTVKNFLTMEGIRAKGCLVTENGEACWDLVIRGVLVEDDYQALITKIDALESIALNTKYVLKIDKTPSTTYEYNVKRITPIAYRESLRTSEQFYEIILKVNSW